MVLKALKAQWRIIRTRKLYYFINVFGLAIGIASSILILLWITDELSYEKMHQRAGQIQQIYKQYNMGEVRQVNPSLPMPLAGTLESEFPEITEALRVVRYRGFVKSGELVYNERNMCAADPAYFRLFSFPFFLGNPETALSEPYSVVLTREQAIKYFGEADALGRTIEIDGRETFTVTGVMENISENTALDFDMVIPFETIHKPGSDDDSWYSHFANTYIFLEKPMQADSLNARLTRHIKSYMSGDNSIEMLAQPIRERHLNDPTAQNPRQMYVYIFSVIGFLVLLIACINFSNVSTFVSLKRTREIGVRKINGGSRKRLVSQFFGETLYQTLAGFVLAMMMVELIRPLFNQLAGKAITIPYLEAWFILSLAGLLVLTTLLAGIYPALLISAFKPVDAFRGRIITGKGQGRLRTALLVFQFAISAGLIITTLTIYNQLGFMQKKNLGFEKENLVYLSLENEQQEHFQIFREKLLENPQISMVSRASSLPNTVWNIVRGMSWEDRSEDETASFAFLSGDEDLVETLGLQVIRGRGFSREFSTDTAKVMVNEKAAKMMGFENPVGKAILSDSTRIEIIGLFRDFHSLPLTENIEPMLIMMWPDYYFYALIRILPGNPEEAMAHIEKIWKTLYPEIPFECNFVDERIDQQYRSETRVGRLSGAFTILAILITCIGLFAIAGHTAQQKNKEIGIRKAMGASDNTVIRFFVLGYVKWVLLANAIAWPLSWLLMKNWLNNFAYRTSQSPGAYLLATLISLLIAVLTIAWHAWKTSRVNPVEVLKTE